MLIYVSLMITFYIDKSRVEHVVQDMSSPANVKIIDVARKPLTDYVFDAVVTFNQGIDELAIRGRGDFISKAVDVYRLLYERLGDTIEITNIEIGSEKFRGRRRSYILIKIKRRY